jgi:hypothetical protein
MISENCIGMDLERSGRGLTDVPFQKFERRKQENRKKENIKNIIPTESQLSVSQIRSYSDTEVLN